MKNKKVAALISVLMLGVLLVATAGLAATVNLQFDSSPTEQGWMFRGIPTATSTDGSRLTINTIGLGDVMSWFFIQDIVEPDLPFTLSMRARLRPSITDQNKLFFQVRQGHETWGGTLYENQISIISEKNIPIPLDGTVFHDFVIIGKPGVKSDFYVDGKLVQSTKPAKGNNPATSLSFGDGDAVRGQNVNCYVEITHFSFSQVSTSIAVNEFVTRFYNECLNREPDQTGLDGWTNALKNGWVTGADLAKGFILSPEFINRGTSDEEFLTILYQAFFNRQPDTVGFNGWLSALQNGTGRSSVLEGFTHSEEFFSLCSQYGIMPYTVDLVKDFVTRFYRECLNREPDQAGLDGWVNGLKNGWVTGGEIAQSFIMSPEYTNLGTSDEEFLETLYQAFFNRQPDTGGFNGWLSALRNGMSRSSVLEGFISSDEFFKLCTDYGIDAVDENKIDNDRDGYTENQGDCNDMASNIHPGATEICGDGIDQDCNGSDLACTPSPGNIDDDRDGYTENQGDCNDFDANIHPNAHEICGDHIDQDCNGSDLICTQTDPSKPWIGNWLLINFLADDENGVWSSDDAQGIGMTAVISDNQWVEKDENNGCAVTFSYAMSSNSKYNKRVVSIGDGCGFSQFWSETGRLVFSDGNNIMIEYFDLLPGDSIIAFKWMRQ